MSKTSKFGFWSTIIALLTWFFALLLLISFISGKVSPKTFPLLYFFSLFFPFFLLANIIFLIINLLRRKIILVIVALIAVLFNFSSMTALLQFNGKNEENTEFSLLSYNVELFNQYNHNDKNYLNDFLKIIKEKSPTIVCFQEYYEVKSSLDVQSEMRNLGYRYMSVCKSNKKINYGNIIFSKYPIENDSLITFSKSKNCIVFADIVLEDKTFRVFNFHLASIGFDFDDYKFYEEVIHLENNSKKSMSSNVKNILKKMYRSSLQRTLQTNLLLKLIEKSPKTVIACGDLNDVPTSYCYKQISNKLNDSFISCGSGFGCTYNGKFPAFRIDYVFFNSKNVCSDFEIIKEKISDHYPVFVRF
ncbi:MAG: endonuclease/exonuclease/phosphatase family protein [Bacteroidales bacterium]|jgi:endonuclease/exonuclease/phosphatase family metal-dependent hydrolase|nr:endonuclease/exonuclease/phosphatase family protein [Bacteroidales bacterium]